MVFEFVFLQVEVLFFWNCSGAKPGNLVRDFLEKIEINEAFGCVCVKKPWDLSDHPKKH